MPMFSDLSNLSHYYSGGSSSLSYLAGPYSGHSSIVAANYRGPSSSSPSSSYAKPSSRVFANRNYKPHLATISENQITRAGLSRINSPKLLYHASPKYKIRKPISINTADIDVSSNRYRSNLDRTSMSSPKKDAVRIDTLERTPSYKENKDETTKDGADDVYMPRIDKNDRSTIKRERTLVRLHTIRNMDDYVDTDKAEADESPPKRDSQKEKETVKVFDKEIKMHKQKWRENFDAEELKPKKRVQQKPLGERLVEKFIIKDKEEKEEEKIMEERRRQREENLMNFEGGKLQRRDSRRQSVKKVPSFHEICKTISSESIDEDLNPGQNIKRRNTRKFSNYDVMKAIRRDSAEFNQQEIQMLDDLIKEAHLDGNDLTSAKPENNENEDPKENIEDNDAKRRKKFTKKKSNEKLVEDEVKEEKQSQRRKIVKRKTSGSLDKAIEAITPKETKENASEINNNNTEKVVEHNIQNKENEVKDDKQRKRIVKKNSSGSLDKSIEAIIPKNEKEDRNEDTLKKTQNKKVVPKITGTVEIETKPNLKLVVDNIHVEETVLSSSSPNTKKFKYNVIIEEVTSPVIEKSDIFKPKIIEETNEQITLDTDKEDNNKITKLEQQLPKIINKEEDEKSKIVNKLLDKKESECKPLESANKAEVKKSKILDKKGIVEKPKKNLDTAEIEKNKMLDKLLGEKEAAEQLQDSLNKPEEEINKMVDTFLTKPECTETQQETVNKVNENDSMLEKILSKKGSLEIQQENVNKAEIEKMKMLDKLLGKKELTEKHVDKAEEEKEKIFNKLSSKKEEEKNEILGKGDLTEKHQEHSINKAEEEKNEMLDKLLGKKKSPKKEDKVKSKAEDEKNKILDKLLDKKEKLQESVNKAEDDKNKMLDKLLGKKESPKKEDELNAKAEDEKNKMLDKLLDKKEKLQESVNKAEDEKNKMLDRLLGKKESPKKEDELKAKAEDEKNKMLDKLLDKKEKLQESVNKAEDEKNKMLDRLLGKKESPKKEDVLKGKAEDEKNKMLDKLLDKKEKLQESVNNAEDEKNKMLDRLLGKKESTEKQNILKSKAEDEKNKIPEAPKELPEQRQESTIIKAKDEKNKIVNKLLDKKQSPEKQDESKSNAENEKNKMLDKILGRKENVPIYQQEENEMKRTKLEDIKKVETSKIIENKKPETSKSIEKKKLETEKSNEEQQVNLGDKSKPILKQNILSKYGQKVEPKFNKTENKIENSNLNAAVRRKQIKKQENLDELDIDNFWERMGKRETIYYKDRRKYLEEKREKEKKDICWSPDWAMEEEDTDKTVEVIRVNKDKHIALVKTSSDTEKLSQSVKFETPNISLEKSTKNMEKLPVNVETPSKVAEKAVSLDKSKLNQQKSVINLAKTSQSLEPSNLEKTPPALDKLSTASNTTSTCLDKQTPSPEKPSLNTSATTLNMAVSKTKPAPDKSLSTTEKLPQNLEPPKLNLSVKQKSEECSGKIRPRLQRKSKSEEQFKQERLELTALQVKEMKAEIKDIKLEPIKPELDFIIKEKFGSVLKPNKDLIVPSASEVLAIEKAKEEAKKAEESTEKKTDEEDDAKDKSLAPLQTNILAIPEPKPKPKPKWFDECPVVIMATPRDLRTRAPVHRGRPEPVPKVTYASESEDSDSSDAESTSSDSSGGSDEYETNIVFDAANANKWKSTSSNDSGFDSSAPGSPANIRNRPDDCDVNCHKKCEKLTANLCGVNQKMIVEALRSVKKGSTNASTSSGSESSSILAPAHNPAFTLEPMEASSAYSAYQRSGRVTPPATSIPRFRKYTVEDFSFLKVLGKGSFGKVMLAELKNTEYYYAVKCLKKDIVLEDDDVECTLIERKVLALGTKHPYLCHLFCTFQTESHLFFVMEYLNGGDLMFHIQVSGRFPEPRGRFYGAEIVSGLKFLHSKGIVYRDLKLDNILLDFDGHVRIADFGMCKLQIFLDRTADTFCGTPDYMAPEIIKGQHYNQGVDWWSFGVLLYEMLIGQSPFSGCDEDELFWSICNERPVIPAFLSKEASQILTLLLEKDCSKRLGNRYCPAGDIKEQPFFHQIDWDKLERRQLEAPFKPKVQHPLDTQYFDKAFTAERVKLTPIEKDILHSMDQTQFHGFSYTNPNATDK